MRVSVAAGVLLAGVGAASAQTVTNGAPLDKFGPVRQLLVQGYEVKAGFSDNSGGAYLVLQKAASAYLCHSSPNQVCEKLN